MNRFKLALKLLGRDRRSGELTLLISALIIAVAGSTTVSLFADRLHRTMTLQTAEFLAADLVITGPDTPPEAWRSKAAALGLKQAQTAEFSSMLIENNELLLAGVKAVSHLYPLRGFLKITASDYSSESTVYQGPEKGSVWVEKRILSALKLKLGDPLTVGDKPLIISHIITYEPDQQGDFYSFSPRVMINTEDLQATGVIQPGSHVHYFFQLSGDAKSLLNFKRWVKPQLNPSQRVMDIHDDRPELGSALSRAERYLGLSSIMVIVISGVAIALATRRYSERHFNTTAILRCLGCKQNEILRLYIVQFAVLGLFASTVGCIAGWIAQEGLFLLLRDLLPQQVAAPGRVAIFFGIITGLTILFGFALPPLLRLRNVSALRVLRHELEPLPSSAWLVFGLALSIICILIWRYTEDLAMTLSFVGAGSLILFILGLTVYGLLLFAEKSLPHMRLTWRFGLQGFIRNRRASVSQILAFSMTLVAMLLSFTVRNDLIDAWQKQLPDHAPNHFALNIFPQQLDDFQTELKNQRISGSRLYPVVKGRLVAINTIPVQKIVSKDSQGESATHRELSLTWSTELPEENKITAGHWWSTDKTGLVSIEKKLADSLKIKLSDQLTFTVGSQQIQASVSSIRELQWGTMKPNFYMIFSPGTLDKYPSAYITSFYLPDSKKNSLNDLVKRFPSITILEVDRILGQIKTILSQLSQAINYLLYFALLAAFTVLLASVYSTMDNRIQEGALMRTLGANRRFLRKTQVIEFCALGLISGIFAVAISETLIFSLYSRVMHIDYHPAFYLWAITPLLSSLIVGLAGMWGVRNVVNNPPVQVLRDL